MRLPARRHHPLEYRMMPRATYCVPQVASFGYTEAQAKEAGFEINVGQFPFIANGKALGLGEKDGFIKIIADKRSMARFWARTWLVRT
jgi:dihydrolipoamide dehydrogenase